MCTGIMLTHCEVFNTFVTDIDECTDNNGGCSQICTNFPGSFECECHDGYHFLENSTSHCTGMILNYIKYVINRTISDTNECLNNNGGCHQICTNTNGSFLCLCQSGYIGSVFCTG